MNFKMTMHSLFIFLSLSPSLIAPSVATDAALKNIGYVFGMKLEISAQIYSGRAAGSLHTITITREIVKGTDLVCFCHSQISPPRMRTWLVG